MGGLNVELVPTTHPDGRPMWEVSVRLRRMYLVVKAFFTEGEARSYEADWLAQREAWERNGEH